MVAAIAKLFGRGAREIVDLSVNTAKSIGDIPDNIVEGYKKGEIYGNEPTETEVERTENAANSKVTQPSIPE